MLTDGGTVETTYSERDEPVEKKLFDDEGTLLYRVVYIRDENGRLRKEKLISENLDIPKTLRDQIPIDERASVLAVMRKKFEEMAQHAELFGNAERAYVYNERGHVAERHMTRSLPSHMQWIGSLECNPLAEVAPSIPFQNH